MAAQFPKPTTPCAKHVGRALASIAAALFFAAFASGESISSYQSWQWNGFSRTASIAAISTPLVSPSSAASSDSFLSLSSISLSSSAASNSSVAILSGGVASLSGVVYYDENANGIRESTDWAISDATVSLVLESSGDTIATVVTAKEGTYSFTGLAADIYTVVLTTPSVNPEEPSVGAVYDADDNLVSIGTNGAPVDSSITTISLEDGYKAVDYDFPQLVYPANLLSKRLLLNVKPGVYHTTPVPEPGALLLTAIAGLAIAGFALRRRK